MAKASMALAELVEKGAGRDLCGRCCSHVAQRLMEFEVEKRTAAPPTASAAPERENSRNGYRDRLWETRAGSVDLRIPKLRTRQLFSGVPRAASDGREGARRGDPRGVHPGRLDALGRRAGQGDGHDAGSPRARCRACAARSTNASMRFLDRPIEGDWPYLWIDATYVKVRAGRPHRLGCRDNRRRRQHRWRCGNARHGGRSERSGAVLD